MSGQSLSAEDYKDLNRLLRMLWQKLVQIIVQSRMGLKMNTYPKTPNERPAAFNVEIEDNESISQELKKFNSSHHSAPLIEKPYSIEVSICSPDGMEMVLEVWTLAYIESDVSSPARMYPTVYDRMAVLLKSAISVSRITPGYKFSFNQDSLKIYYKLYDGDPQYECLGEGHCVSAVGKITTPLAHISLSVAYRTAFNKGNNPKIHMANQILVKSDHFTLDMSPKHRKAEKDTDSTETFTTSDTSQDPCARIFTVSPSEFDSSFQSHSSSDSDINFKSDSNHKDDDLVKLFLPFADIKQPRGEVVKEVPVEKLLSSALFDSPVEEERQDLPKEEVFDPASSTMASSLKKEETDDSTDESDSTDSSGDKGVLDYVVVDMKPSFLPRDPVMSDLQDFINECKVAPALNLDSIDSEESVEIEDLSKQLQIYESNLEDYDELVKSLEFDGFENSEVG